jgi:hypothetical protein
MRAFVVARDDEFCEPRRLDGEPHTHEESR